MVLKRIGKVSFSTSDVEWTTLTMYLGDANNSGGKLKSV